MELASQILASSENARNFEISGEDNGWLRTGSSLAACDLGFCFMNHDFIFSESKLPPSFKLYSRLRNSQSAIFQGFQFGAPAKKNVYLDGKVVGVLLSDAETEQILVFGLCPENAGDSAPRQAEKLFVLMKRILEENKFRFADITRTWFFNKDILSWYSDFNQVRTNFYCDNGVFENLLPASTGIGANNIQGAAISCGFHAVKRKDCGKAAAGVESPLQCSAEKYKSSFSRAVELSLCGYKKLYISGTASINKNGETIHIGNCAAQIEETMRVVNAILESKNISWENISRAIAYFRNREDIPLFKKFIYKNKIYPFPCINVQAVICRENLLFEIEADAIMPK